MITLSTIIIIIAYLIIVAFLSYLGYLRTHNTQDYMVAGRKSHPAIMALSYGATFISTSAIIGFGGAAAVYGMGLLWLTFLNIFAGIFIAFIFFGKRTRQMGHNLDAHTFPELLSKRFKSPFIQKYAGTVIFVFMPLYASAVMIGAAKIVESFFKINYDFALLFVAVIVALYVAMGGIKGVLYTDAFQASLMSVGMLFLLIAIYSKLGGVTQAHEQLTALMSNASVQEQTAGMAAKGFLGWTSMPRLGSPNWFSLVTTVVMGVGIGVLAQPQLSVRFMMVKSNRELNRAVPIGGIFILLMTGVAFVVGSLSNVLFFNSIGKISIAAAENVGDNVIPKVIDSFLPSWFGVIFLVAMMSAAMSTLSSQAHTLGTSLSRDMFTPKREKENILLPKLGILIGMLLTTALAYYLPKTNLPLIIATGTALFFGICAAAFLPMYVGALYIRRMSKAAAISGMVAGSASSILWMLFVHEAESAKITLCKAIFGVDTLARDSLWRMVDPILIALPISILVTVLVGIFAKKESDDRHIEAVFKGI